MEMSGWRVHEFGHYREVMVFESFERPAAPKGGVLVEVKAAALNFPDMLSIAGQYQVKAPLPFTPGIEAAGVVVEVGEGSRFEVGDRVIASGLWGAFAQFMPAVDMSCFAIPDGMSDEDAAALLVVYQTGYFGLVYRAALQAGEVLLVHGGAGGVGTAAIQLGKALGATVIATAGREEKLQVCRDCGADHVINYVTQDFVKEVKALTGGKGADVIFDPVGGDVFDKSARCIAFGGRLLVIGFAGGRIPEIKANRILLKNMAVVGLFWGDYQRHDQKLIHTTHEKLCGLYKEGAFRPVICQTFDLEALPEAFGLLESRASTGKVIVRP